MKTRKEKMLDKYKDRKISASSRKVERLVRKVSKIDERLSKIEKERGPK